MKKITMTINGKPRSDEVEPRLLFIHYLREVVGLTGPHVGCETSICGACTVAVNGQAVKACTMFAVQADGGHVRTIEGLGSADGELHPVQHALWKHHGLQCGFCTPGIVATLIALLEESPERSEAEVRDAMSGHICRCTGYQSIVAAALAAAQTLRGRS